MCCIVNYETVNRPWQERMLTKDILFGLNLLTLAGFAVMGLSLTLQRSGQIGAPLSIGLMSVGTALVVYGLYARGENG
jgi:CHASE2 domain-containing sensor protein